MSKKRRATAVEILLVEDNPGDVRLTEEAIKEGAGQVNLSVVNDGVAAMDFLHRRGVYAHAPQPNMILLDLKLPKKDGLEVLAEIKANQRLRRIPVVVLTTSEAPEDILKAYDLQASCYITKPADLDQFIQVVRSVEDLCLTVVKLPPRE